ncbi:caspase, EACC1-associated type [Saccharopolyspora cebuensis]|uniref:caspase, EACC1-associated type n=1 Tax=Saccharopolyspora cebuensis TaxID=418759 RepID=UPI0031E7794A
MTGKRRALLIATESYSDATFRRLRAPHADAEALAAVLRDPAIGGYEVEALRNPPAHVANLAIEDLFAAARLDDLVLLYLSGHGIKDDYGRLHLAMANSRHDRLNATAVSAQFVRNQMDGTRSRRVVVVLDCCFAGAFPPGSTHRTGENAGALEQLGGRGSAVMTSSSALEYSFESGEDAGSTLVGAAGPSVFTGALVEGLRTGSADRNADGLVDVDELYDFIYAQVEAAGKPQTPGLDSRFQGRLVVATSPAGTDLPPEIGQAMRSPLPSVRLAIVGELSGLLRSDGAEVAEAARAALATLTGDAAGSVAAAAHAALARAETAAKEAADEQASRPVKAPEVPDWTDHHEDAQAPGVWSPSARRTVLISLAAAVATASLVAAATLFPWQGGSEGGSAGHAVGDSAGEPVTQTEQVRIPQGFVTPPTRPTPLPAQVTCQYPSNGDEPVRPVERPESGEVAARGLVRADINTSIGTIPAILDRSLAPCTVNAFIHRVGQGFYESTPCHGGLLATLDCGYGPGAEIANPGYSWTNEVIPDEPNLRGYLLMDATSHAAFGIAFEDYGPWERTTVFGTISEEGLKLIDAKRAESDDPSNRHLSDIVVTGVDIQS